MNFLLRCGVGKGDWLLLSLFLLALGTGMTLFGSKEEMAALVVAGVIVIVLGLRLLRPVSKTLLHWLDYRGL